MPRACCQPKGLARISASCRREYALEEEHSELSNVERRVRALETVMTQKGYIDPAALDVMIDTYQTKVRRRNGARVVARAWVDPAFRGRLLPCATAAIAALGCSGRQSAHVI